MTTPDRITSLADNEVFVFGSNYAGKHGKGAALLALRKFGAKPGQGTGSMGRSYGIATKDERLRVLPLDKIASQIAEFLRFARERPKTKFLVTQVGCGLAGYSPSQIQKMIAAGDATLVAWPEVVTHSGQRAVTEDIQEVRYPTKFDGAQATKIPGSETKPTKESAPHQPARGGAPVPTAFENSKYRCNPGGRAGRGAGWKDD